MNLHALDIPETTRDLADWLEGHLVGLHLGPLVAELLVVRGDTPHRPIEVVLGGDLSRVLQNGLGDLGRDRLAELLQNPTALLELQERIVIDGGPYWQRRAEVNPETQAETGSAWRRLQAAIASPSSGPQSAPARGGMARRVLLFAATAAILVIGVAVVWQNQLHQQGGGQQVAGGWAFDKPGAMPENATPREYLNALADAAGDWFKRRPQRAEGLEKRLTEFRHGCETLIAAEHRPLSPEDRAWLVERCQKWKAKIEGHLADLKSTGDVQKVRDAADETVNGLIKALRERKPA